MVGLNDEDQNKIKKEIKHYFYLEAILMLIILAVMLKNKTEPNNSGITIIAIVYSFVFLLAMHLWKLYDDLRDDKIRKEEREIKFVEDRINLFYLPLQNLLTIYDEHGPDDVKLKIRNELKGHKYLAEPDLCLLFETYLQETEESKKISKERLSDMASRDLENLQKRFRELNEQ